MILDIIRERQPDAVWLGPWSIMQSVNDPKIVAEKRVRYLPVTNCVASILKLRTLRSPKYGH